jgi:hypothetical protein
VTDLCADHLNRACGLVPRTEFEQLGDSR